MRNNNTTHPTTNNGCPPALLIMAISHPHTLLHKAVQTKPNLVFNCFIPTASHLDLVGTADGQAQGGISLALRHDGHVIECVQQGVHVDL